VRNVGYRFVPLKTGQDSRRSAARDADPAATGPRAATRPSATTEPPAGDDQFTGRDDQFAGGDDQFAGGKADGLVPGTVRGG
jgi:hypothetical protein